MGKMKKFPNKKGTVPIIIIAISAVVVAGIGYGAYHFFSQKPTSLPVGPSALPNVAPKTLEINFSETGNLLNWDSQTETYTENWTLLYEKPGNPAISVDLVFNEASFCDLGEEKKLCDKSKLNNGDRAQVEGNKNNKEVMVINLKKL